MSESNQVISKSIVVPFQILDASLPKKLLDLCSEKFQGISVNENTYIDKIFKVEIEKPGTISRTTGYITFPVLLHVRTIKIEKGSVFNAKVLNVDQWGTLVEIDSYVKCLVINQKTKKKAVYVKITSVKPETKGMSCTGEFL